VNRFSSASDFSAREIVDRVKTFFQKFMHSHLVVSFIRWFDTSASTQETAQNKVDWVRCIPFLAVHAVCFAVIWVGWSWTAVGVAVALYVIRMFAITGFYHRYFSHKTFKTSRAAQFAFAVVGNSAMQRGPLWWAAQHRHHHQFSDQEDDKHSPHRHGLMWSHMLWIMSRANFATNLRSVPDLVAYPELCFLDRFDFLVPFLLALSMFFFGWGLEVWYPQLGTTAWQMLIWGFFISTIVLFHATSTINSLSHLFGFKRYNTGDESRNNPILAVITLGEGWHNNHHRYAASVQQGFFWWEYDITFYLLKMFSWVGIIWDMKTVPAHILEEAEHQTATAAGE
jgi:stearoyl-CoA desaturase (Delta-9 desaturase)